MLGEDHGYFNLHSGEDTDEYPREEVPLTKVSPHLYLPEIMPELDA